MAQNNDATNGSGSGLGDVELLATDTKVALAFGLGFVGMMAGVMVASVGNSGGFFESVGMTVVGLLIIGASATFSVQTVGRLRTENQDQER